MANIFSANEIVMIGIQIEKNGKDFYNALINQSKNEKAKELYKFLSGEETKHIVTFQNILDKLDASSQAESYPGEYMAYMKDLSGKYVFTQKDKGEVIAKQTKNDKEAIDLGIGFEKDSIIFYEGIKKAIPQAHHKVVDELILQETSHLNKLNELKTNL
ncbi:MAG: ferritin family protein [Candidatus Omnitrophota bacterium]